MEKQFTDTVVLELQAEVLQLLNWSKDEFSIFMYETGIEYLKAYFGKDEEVIDRLSERREFWNWFKNHWYYRDKSFFESFLLNQCSLEYRLIMYRGLHNPTILASDIYPTRQVLGNEFSTVKISISC